MKEDSDFIDMLQEVLASGLAIFIKLYFAIWPIQIEHGI
jgi:hypothetical protein